jgi:sec-independent protein translocase protein TatC
MDETRLSLVEHLTDLRRAILVALAAFLAATVAGYLVSSPVFAGLKAVLPAIQVVYLGPLDGLYLQLRLAVTIGLMLSMPVTAASLAWFVAPGLTQAEKLLAIKAGLAATVLFALGAAYTVTVALPVVMSFLLSFTTAEMTPFIAAEEFLSFVMSFIIYGGLLFELPLLLFLLIRYDILSPELVGRQRKLLAGFLTMLVLFFSPGGDLVVQLLLAVPLYLLFEGAVVLARHFRRNGTKGVINNV